MKKELGYILSPRDLNRDTCSLFKKYAPKMKIAFAWQAESTYTSYKHYIASLYPYLHNIPFRDCTDEDFDNAIATMNEKKSRPYAPNTLKSIRSAINDLCYFAEVYSRGLYQNTLWGTVSDYDVYVTRPTGKTKQDRKREYAQRQKELENHAKLPRSLSIIQELKLIDSIRRNYMSNSLYMGIAIMFYLGLRPGEACGLKFGDIRPLDGYSDIYCMYIYNQIRDNQVETNKLKTPNAYRILPVPTELYELLQKREQLVCKRIDGDTTNCYILCRRESAAGMFDPCNRRRFTILCKNELKQAAIEQEVLSHLDAERKGSDDMSEASVTSYLLRRNFATALLGVCGMNDGELKYMMGHAIYDKSEKHRDYLDPDTLHTLWDKLNRRRYPAEYQEYLTAGAKSLKIHQRTAKIEVTEDAIPPSGSAILQIWADYPNDCIDFVIGGNDSIENVKYRVFHEPITLSTAERVHIHEEFSKAVQASRNRSSSRKKANKEDVGTEAQTRDNFLDRISATPSGS